eukprot:TRINITY_DN615_c0_g1_i1.p2 TRINITY_DN615_c0_g1~~TRINITY_DN615_c0_g1_i1.p2  ORF type:complete len:110 (-),score=33.94 TRINITY_DN615_c0_g1_i1:139-468(-)
MFRAPRSLSFAPRAPTKPQFRSFASAGYGFSGKDPIETNKTDKGPMGSQKPRYELEEHPEPLDRDTTDTPMEMKIPEIDRKYEKTDPRKKLQRMKEGSVDMQNNDYTGS